MRLSGYDVSGTSPHFRSTLVFEMRSEQRYCVLFAVGSLPRAENDGHARTLSLQVPEVVASVFQILGVRRHVGVSHLAVASERFWGVEGTEATVGECLGEACVSFSVGFLWGCRPNPRPYMRSKKT
jgi:hypothetical protein